MTLEGLIDEILRVGRFGVTLENGHRIIACTAGRMHKFRIRSVVGDGMLVEMPPTTLARAASSSGAMVLVVAPVHNNAGGADAQQTKQRRTSVQDSNAFDF